jgi:hypothetical protein
MLQRRRLLNYVFSNSTWKDGRLTPTFRQPFDMLADANVFNQEKKAADQGASGLSEKYLPFVVSFRTWLALPFWERDPVFWPIFYPDHIEQHAII